MSTIAGLIVPPMSAVPSSPADGPWWAVANPFHYLSSAAGKVVADAWTTAMVSIWKAGLMLFRFVLNMVDAFTTPDLSANGPARDVYATTLWIAGTLVLLLGMVQLGGAALRRDGRSLATLAMGFAKFVIVCAGWVSYGTALVTACGGLTKALMRSLLDIDSWAKWDPWQPVSTHDISDGGIATLLGLLGAFLVFAAITHLLVMLARGGALVVLVAVTPIAAAGQIGELGQAWLWKSLRWFHAAALTPVLMVLVTGVGVKISTAAATSSAGKAADIPAQLATAVPSIMVVLISCVAPLALFKLLAFVDPSTSSGSAMRAGLAAQGGLSGMLSGGATSSTSGASSADETGRSAGEDGAADITSQRFASSGSSGAGSSFGTLASSMSGAVGGAVGKGFGAVTSIGSSAGAIGSDLTNQMGVGHHAYHPDFTGTGSNTSGSNISGSSDPSGASNDDARQSGGGDGGGMDPEQTLAPTTPSTSSLPGGGFPAPPSAGSAAGGGAGRPAPAPGGPGQGSGGAAAGAGSEAAAAAVVV